MFENGVNNLKFFNEIWPIFFNNYCLINYVVNYEFCLFIILWLQINVLDCNDHSPVFEMQQYEASVREGASPGTTVLTLKATDQDIGKNAEV